MKVKKILSTVIAMAVSAALLSVTAFADIDYMAEAEANDGLLLKGSAGWAGGQWIVGNDKAVMENPLTIADLEAADHFEITYTSTEVPPTLTEGDVAKLTFCYKFATSLDETGLPATSEAYLPEGWFQYGPTGELGNSYHSIDIFAWDVQSEGTLIVPTSTILDSIVDKDSILFMTQFGIGNNTYDFDDEWADEADLGADYNVTITGVKLCDEPDEASQAIAEVAETEVTDAAETESELTEADETEVTEAPAETTVAETTTAEVTTVEETTQAPAVTEEYSGFPIWGFIAIGAGVLLIVVVVVVLVAKKKK